MTRVLVCGGRDYGDKARLFVVLDDAIKTHGLTSIIHGAARGADLLAEEWARSRQVPYLGVPARWNEEGTAAGPLRNQRMIARAKPEVCIAFPGGSGTLNCVHQAEDAGIMVVKIDW